MLINLILWYLVIALAGWLVYPLAYRLLAFLPDRGLALARPLGLLLWGYIYWLLNWLGVLQNNTGGVLLALLLVGALSLWRLWAGGWQETVAWLRDHGKLMVVTELLFLALFAFWAVMRAANPEASSTEKPMELAFINAILRSPTFPPADPWLAGYAISYYYFGYVMVAMLARLAGVPGAIAFNLALASWFALAGLAAYGLLYNLLAARGKQLAGGMKKLAAPLFAPLLAPLFLLLASNLEGFLEILHARGLFWQGEQSSFWKWLNIQELVNPPTPPLLLRPQRVTGIWWWRASRVLQDFDLNGGSREIIDEFPAFSYLLGDLHPHVLAMPFVLLALGLALNTYLRLRQSPENPLRVGQWLRTPDFWIAALALGGLSFLNTWDFPIYLALFAAAVIVARLPWTGWNGKVIVQFGEVAAVLLVTGVLLYLPFYLGFASQANGLLPSLVFFTRGVYFWIMFGSLLLPILTWLVWLAWRRRAGNTAAFVQGLLAAVGLIAGLWLLSSLLGVRIFASDPGLVGIWGASPDAPLLQQAFLRRLASPFTMISLLVLLALAAGLIQSFRCRPSTDPAYDPQVAQKADAETDAVTNGSDPFVLLLILLGIGLVLFPEFFYLRDQFGWRMNTIFKFYFQTWIVWSIAAGYASVVLFQALRRPAQAVAFRITWAALLMMALTYSFFAIPARASDFKPSTWTLDASFYLQDYDPQEWEGIRWLQSAPYGVVAEAVGGSYSGFARVSTQTGLPSVLGWPGHESQWRGGGKEIGTREPDIALVYKSLDWEQVNTILIKYHVRYVYLGSEERSKYYPNDPNEAVSKQHMGFFQQHLKSVFHNEVVTIYEVPSYNVQQEQAAQP